MTDAAHAWIVGNSGAILRYYEPDNIPVELTGFSASVQGNDVMLNWSTATELNNSGFEIEKKSSSQNSDFSSIAFIPGRGTTTEISSYSYSDKNLNNGTYNYRLKQIDYNGSYTYYNLEETIEIKSPFKFELAQNYPNPFNPSTALSFVIAHQSLVSLKVFDILGNEIATLINEEKHPGVYEVEFSASTLPSGVYFYQMKAGSFIQTRKMVLLR
jgi:hypothetical protein